MQEDERYDQRGIYRSRDGWIFGVCQGLADHWDFSVGWLRLIVVVASFFMGGVLPIVAYVAAGLLMKPDPAGRA